MKLPSFYLLALLLSLHISCEDAPQPDPPLQFSLLSSPCVVGGTAFRVEVSDKEKYAYLWQLDGEALGHYKTTPCVCGDSISIQVTRLSNSLRLKKSSSLLECSIQ